MGFQRLLILGLAIVLSTSGFASDGLDWKEAVSLLKNIQSEYGSDDVSVRLLKDVNDGDDPGLLLGEPIAFDLASDDDWYYLMAMVDPKGVVSVVFPDFAISEVPKPYRTFRYPPEGTGEFTQEEPVGIVTVILYATDVPLRMDELGFPETTDVHIVGNGAEQVQAFVDRCNQVLAGTSSRATEYQYYVDDPDMQFGTRAARRELKRRIEQVDILAKKDKTQTAARRKPEQNAGAASTGVQSESLAVHGIRFETNSDVLTGVGKTQLDVFGSELVSLLEESPEVSVFLEGHTDDTGSHSYNQELSVRRADAAKRYLMTEFGIGDRQLVASGQGETRPLAENVDTVSRALNRRVEIRIGLQSQ